MKLKLPKALFAAVLAACVSVSSAETTNVTAQESYVFASSSSGTTDVDVTVNAGSTKNFWAAAFGRKDDPGKDNNDLILGDDTTKTNVTMTFSGSFTGTGDYEQPDTTKGDGTTVFGIVNAGKVTGDVSLIFDAPNADYHSFTTTNASSVVGSFQGTIEGCFNVNIKQGTFHHDVIGGFYKAGETKEGDTDTIGSTSITINGGTIKGNVYGGGLTGLVTGDTAVTVNSLTPFGSHTQSNVISAGGTGGTIGGNATLTFHGIVDGEYKGTVQGEGNATVNGTSKLVVSGSSTLTLNTVQDFDAIEVQSGSALTINGAITTDALLHTVFDSDTVATKTTNGLGNGIVMGLVSGEGNLAVGTNATLNGKAISGYSNGGFVMENAVY